MRLEGTLDAFSLPDIFQLLSFTKKSGALRLQRGATRGVVHFTAGSVTGAVSDVSRHGLARRLAGSPFVADEALLAAVERAAADPAVGVARALLEAGAVDEQALRSLAAEHAVDAVFDLLRWPDGDFALGVDETNPDELGVQLGVDDVVTEARRRQETWAAVTRLVPSPDAVPVLASRPETELAVSEDEWALLGLLDGRRTVAEVVAITGRGEYAIVSTLAGLVERGLVVVRLGDEEDAVAALHRRQALLGRLDGPVGPPPGDDPSDGPGGGGAPADRSHAGPAPVVPPTPEVPAQHVPMDMPRAGAAESQTQPPAQPLAQPPAQPLPEPVAARPHLAPTAVSPATAGVTPVRAEPFLPRRRPDHPDDPPVTSPVASGLSAGTGAGVGSVVGSSAVAPHPVTASAPAIERDPSVNKSLLLRLIAGVRGL